MDDIRLKYNDRWVAITVTKRDKNLQPAEGVVIADDIDRYRLRQKVAKYDDICIFFVGDPHYPILF